MAYPTISYAITAWLAPAGRVKSHYITNITLYYEILQGGLDDGRAHPPPRAPGRGRASGPLINRGTKSIQEFELFLFTIYPF